MQIKCETYLALPFRLHNHVASESLFSDIHIEFKSLTRLKIFAAKRVPTLEIGNGNLEALSDTGE